MARLALELASWRLASLLHYITLSNGQSEPLAGGVYDSLGGGSLPQSAAAQAAFAISYTQLFSLITWTSVGLMGAAAAIHSPQALTRLRHGSKPFRSPDS